MAGIPHASTCGGRARCTLCRVRVHSGMPLPAPAEVERRVSERLGVDSQSVRLACQLRPTHEISVWPLVPPEASKVFLQPRQQRAMAEERFAARLKLAEMPRNSSATRLKNRCALTGRPRSYYRKFKLSRIALRELASLGQIPGMVKSSW